MFIIHMSAYIHTCLLTYVHVLETCSLQSLRLLLVISLVKIYDGTIQQRHLDPWLLHCLVFIIDLYLRQASTEIREYELR